MRTSCIEQRIGRKRLRMLFINNDIYDKKFVEEMHKTKLNAKWEDINHVKLNVIQNFKDYCAGPIVRQAITQFQKLSKYFHFKITNKPEAGKVWYCTRPNWLFLKYHNGRGYWLKINFKPKLKYLISLEL